MTYSTHLLRHIRFTIGQNIQRRRVGQKLTLHKLSRLTGLPETRLDHYELGKNELDFAHLVKIACALEVQIAELLVAR